MNIRSPTSTLTATLRRSSMWRRRISLALSLGTQMRTVEATHVLVLFFPALGMIPAVVVAVHIYVTGSTEFVSANHTDPMLRFTPVAFYPEPFSSLSNLATVSCGFGLFLMPMISGSFLAPQIFGVGMVLSFLGAGSWAFHKDASRVGHWQHVVDRIGMFTAFAYLAVVVLCGCFHSTTMQPVKPRSQCSLLSNLACMAAVSLCIVYQDHIDTATFLGAFGTIVVTANAVTTSMLAWHDSASQAAAERKEPERLGTCSETGVCIEDAMKHKLCADGPRAAATREERCSLLRALRRRCFEHTFEPKRLKRGVINVLRQVHGSAMAWHSGNRHLSAVAEGLLEALTCCLFLVVGFALNGEAARCRAAAAHNATLSDAVRRGMVVRHDILHGTWHWLTAMAMLAMGLTMHRGLCVSERAGAQTLVSTPRAGVKEEKKAKALLLAITLLMLVLLSCDMRTAIVIWVVVLSSTVPISLSWLIRVMRQSDMRHAERIAAIRVATRRGLAASKPRAGPIGAVHV